jgi:hypothetical protein
MFPPNPYPAPRRSSEPDLDPGSDCRLARLRPRGRGRPPRRQCRHPGPRRGREGRSAALSAHHRRGGGTPGESRPQRGAPDRRERCVPGPERLDVPWRDLPARRSGSGAALRAAPLLRHRASVRPSPTLRGSREAWSGRPPPLDPARGTTFPTQVGIPINPAPESPLRCPERSCRG